MHIGQTRQVEHVVGRKSLLGWVTFGSSTGRLNNVTTTVVHVRFKENVDLSDFWTTESMRVTVKPYTCDANKLSQSEREKNSDTRFCREGWKSVEDPISIAKRSSGVARQENLSFETSRVNCNRTSIVEESFASSSIQRQDDRDGGNEFLS